MLQIHCFLDSFKCVPIVTPLGDRVVHKKKETVAYTMFMNETICILSKEVCISNPYPSFDCSLRRFLILRLRILHIIDKCFLAPALRCLGCTYLDCSCIKHLAAFETWPFCLIRFPQSLVLSS